MKLYKMKQLPIGGSSNFADMGQLQRRIEDLELAFNLLKMNWTESIDPASKLPPEAVKLFELIQEIDESKPVEQAE